MLIPLSKADTCPPRENKKLNKFLASNLLDGSGSTETGLEWSQKSILTSNFYYLDTNRDGRLSEQEITHLVALRKGEYDLIYLTESGVMIVEVREHVKGVDARAKGARMI